MNHDQLTANGWKLQADGSYSKTTNIVSVPPVSIAQIAVAQSTVFNESVAKEKRETTRAKRLYVRITSFRHRLLDPDNICSKYIVDCLRYAKIIPNDRAADIELVTTQRKIDRKTEETTEILITEI